MQNEVNIANLDSNVATLTGVSNAKINSTANGDLRIDIAGNNTIANAANIYVNICTYILGQPKRLFEFLESSYGKA